MALLFCEGFEDGAAAWALQGSMAVISGGRSGNCLSSAGNTLSRGDTGFAATASPIIGFAFKTTGTSALANISATGANHLIIQHGAAGQINVYRSSSATLLGSTASGIAPNGAWNYIEIKATIHDTTGSVILRVNGVEVLNLTNIDTRDGAPTTANILILGPVSGTGLNVTSDSLWDDVYICDTSGSFNNDFLGDVTVEHLRPAADDTVTWVGSDGNSTDNYALVDEAGAYSGVDYVESPTVGQRDLYTSTASSKATSTPVAAVMAVAVAMRDDSGSLGLKLNIKEGATVRASSTIGLPTSFGELSTVFDRKNDGSAWTVADVNALRMGYEVTA